MRRIRRRRTLRGRPGRRVQVLLSILVGLLLGAAVVYQMHTRLRPAVLAAASNYLDNQVSEEIYRTVETLLEEQEIGYDSIYTPVYGPDGSILALQADLTQLHSITTAVTADVMDAFDDSMISQRVEVPVGTLLGTLALSGKGPSVTVEVLSVGNISASYQNEFISQGINQTLHRVVLHVTSDLSLLLPGGVADYFSECDIILAETVLLGDVPESYTYFGGSDLSASDFYHYGISED